MVAGECKLYGKQWGDRESTLIYVHKKPAKEITVQILSGNIKRTLKQIMKDLVADFSKSPSKAFQVWKIERKRQILQNAWAAAKQKHFAVGLCSAQLSPLQTWHQNPLSSSGRTLQKSGGTLPKWLVWGGESQCSHWREITRGAVFLFGLHHQVI